MRDNQAKSKANFIKKINLIAGIIGKKFIRIFSHEYRNKISVILDIMQDDHNFNLSFDTFVGYKLLSALTLIFVCSLFGKGSFLLIIAAISLGITGFFIPDILLRRFNIKRTEDFNKELPYVIDLLFIATLSGQNIYNAIKILVEKHKGNISSELKKFLKDVDLGVGKTEAYKNVLSRNSTGDFKKLLFLLLQAEKYGSAISDVLKQKSKFIKFEISQSYDRKSRKVAISMLFPLVFLILPSFVLLVGGPLLFALGGNLFFS
ncbi:MAG: type II secretion system F family protein [Actinobacteria bacterium]|nr:type II secretion system F family protein [Actinomycetota bacterium]